MRNRYLAFRVGMRFFGLALVTSAALAQQPAVQSGANTLDSNTAESLQLYRQMHAVLSHPRCVNCHPKDDTPVPCKSCLNEANFDPGRVSGAPNWHLAPTSMPKPEFDRVVTAWANTGGACPE